MSEFKYKENGIYPVMTPITYQEVEDYAVNLAVTYGRGNDKGERADAVGCVS